MTRIAIGVATFYTDLAERLETSAVAALAEAGIEGGAIERFEVPGAFELPVIAKYAADAGFDAVVLLGAVIRGQTSHYDHVCEEVARGIMEVQLTTGVPCGFGVLTVESMEQAISRSGGDKRDSAQHAVQAVLALLGAKERLAEQ
jgi:6,7-dimethyl-8-ribityllumazine synthase